MSRWEKALRTGETVAWGQMSVWRKGILGEGYCKQCTLELWVHEGKEEKMGIMKENRNVRLTARVGSLLFRRREEMSGGHKQKSPLLCAVLPLVLGLEHVLFRRPASEGVIEGTLPTTWSAPELSRTKPTCHQSVFAYFLFVCYCFLLISTKLLLENLLYLSVIFTDGSI